MSREPFEGVRRLFRIRSLRRDLDEELAFHFDETVADLRSQGWSEDAARAEARRRFGDERHWRREMEKIDRRAEARRRRADLLQTAWESVRYAFRGIRRAPGFAAAVVLTFGLGIGANVTMFGILDRILLRAPEHIVDPDGVKRVVINRLNERRGEREDSEVMSYPDYADLTGSRSFSGVAAYANGDVTVGKGPDAVELEGVMVTSGFFGVLGANPVLGRFFTPEEDRIGGPPVVVISHELWQSRFGGERSAIGETLDFGKGLWEVVGVAPAGFTGVGLRKVDVWLPLHSWQAARLDGNVYWQEPEGGRNWWWLSAVARLAPGVTAEQAEAEATVLHRQGRQEQIASDDYDPAVRVAAAPLIAARGAQASDESVVAKWLAGVSLLVLLIACANVANLLLARAVRHRREIGIRLALGISRRRLLGQIVLESLVLATLGGLAAVLTARWSGDLVRGVLLPDIYWPESAFGTRTLLFVLLVAGVAGLLAGILPAVQASRPGVVEALKSGARTITGAGNRTRGVLTVVQAALSVVLLVGAGLFVRSLNQVQSLDLGIEPEQVLIVNPVFDGAPDDEQKRAFYREATEQTRRMPGVVSASAPVGLPFWSGYGFTLRVPGLDSIPSLPTGGPSFHAVDAEYFEVMGLSVLSGRGISERDTEGAPRVVVVNETMARMLWPGEDALGKCILIQVQDNQPDPPCAEVVGVVENGRRWRIIEEASMQYYTPLAQRIATDNAPETMLIRAEGDPKALIPVLRREFAADARLRYLDVIPFQQQLDPQTRSWKLGATMFTAFGVLALVVAAIGLYSLLAFSVAQRTHEFGIRAALGATRERLLALVLAQGMRLVVVGVAIGLVISFLAAPRLEALLYETSPRDPWILGIVAAVLLGVAAVASTIPALRATRVAPQEALRAD